MSAAARRRGAWSRLFAFGVVLGLSSPAAGDAAALALRSAKVIALVLGSDAGIDGRADATVDVGFIRTDAADVDLAIALAEVLGQSTVRGRAARLRAIGPGDVATLAGEIDYFVMRSGGSTLARVVAATGVPTLTLDRRDVQHGLALGIDFDADGKPLVLWNRDAANAARVALSGPILRYVRKP